MPDIAGRYGFVHRSDVLHFLFDRYTQPVHQRLRQLSDRLE